MKAVDRDSIFLVHLTSLQEAGLSRIPESAGKTRGN